MDILEWKEQALKVKEDMEVQKSSISVPLYGPSKPSVKSLTATSCIIRWDPPNVDENELRKLDGYCIYWRMFKNGSLEKMVRLNQMPVRDMQHVVKSLMPGCCYQFQVCAVNDAGIGPPSLPSEFIKAIEPPFTVNKPEIVQTYAHSCSIRWECPTYDGGSPIKGYHVQCRDISSNHADTVWETVNVKYVTKRELLIKKLKKNAWYQIRVAAVNEAGIGKWSMPSEKFEAVQPPNAPGQAHLISADASSCILSWDVPDDGGSPITSYEVESCKHEYGGWFKVKTTTNNYKCQIPNLLKGEKYWFRIIAVNKKGASLPGKASDIVATIGVPSAPSKPIVSANLSSCTLKWTSPKDNGGSSITSYEVEQRYYQTDCWDRVRTVKSTVYPSCTISNLLKGRTYQFRVSAVNAKGHSIAVTSDEVEAIDPPSSPSKPDVIACDSRSCNLRWNPPFDNGGSKVTSYRIQQKGTDYHDWIDVTYQPVTGLTYCVPGLLTGNKYYFRVVACNKKGRGVPGEISDLVEAVGFPGAPSKPYIQSSNGHHTLICWSPPLDDGGSPITSYDVEQAEYDGFLCHRTGMSTFITVDTCILSTPNLTKGKQYKFKVTAINKKGPGEAGEWSDVIKAIDLPCPLSKPEICHARGNSCLLRWNTDGHGEYLVDHYEVEQRQLPDFTWSKATTVVAKPGPTRSCKIYNLIKGARYQFRINFVNIYEECVTGDMSEIVEAIDPPSAPSKPQAEYSDATSCLLKWNAPKDNGGSPVIFYLIEQAYTDNKQWTVIEEVEANGNPQFKLGHLIKGKSYQFRVIAGNKKGESDAGQPSDTIEATEPPSSPGKPQIVEFDSASCKLTWTIPKDDGGTPIKSYIIEQSQPDTDNWMMVGNVEAPNQSKFEVSNLRKGKKYKFRILAVNNKGPSKVVESDVIEAIERPSPPSQPRVISSDGLSCKLSWHPPKDDGGSPVKEYQIEQTDSEYYHWEKVWTKEAIQVPAYAVTGLKRSKRYQFRIIALNKVGHSQAGRPSEEVDTTEPPAAPYTPVLELANQRSHTLQHQPTIYNIDTTGRVLDNEMIQDRDDGLPVHITSEYSSRYSYE